MPKLFQAAGALSVANLLFVDPGSSTDIILATGLVGGIGGVTYSLWWFSRAYVGELRLLSQAACELHAKAASHKFIGRTLERSEFPGCVRWGGGFVGRGGGCATRSKKTIYGSGISY